MLRIFVAHIFASLLSLLLALPMLATAEQIDNLLKLETTRSLPSIGQSIDPDQIALVIDGDLITVGKFEQRSGDALNLLFDLGEEVFSPDAATIVLGAENAPVKIDILGSNISDNSGFFSLRSSRLDSSQHNVKLKFRPAAVRWLLVRVFPQDGALSLSFSELSISGQRGKPETPYSFSESPAKALDIVAQLSNLDALTLDISPQEYEVFEQARAGDLPWDTFVKASLLASNITDQNKQNAYIQKLETLTQQANSAIGSVQSKADQGRALLSWLHQTVLTNGYFSGQTDLSTVLDRGTYNCVSSAVIYNILAKRLGIDARAIEVPDHAFSIVYDSVNHMDVETTTPDGFNPSRDRIAEFENLTGFSYIPQSNITKRREIGDAGLAALIYYNHGVTAAEQGQYYNALTANLKAISLDPDFASAAKNALAALANWSLTLSGEGRWEDALSVIQVGSELAPDDALLANNHKAIWSNWAKALAAKGDREAALAVLNRGHTALPDAGLEALQAWVFIEEGETQAVAQQWEQALRATDAGLGLLEGQARADLEAWRASIYLRWMNSRLDMSDFASVPGIIQAGLTQYPDDKRLLNAIPYLGQEWADTLPEFGVAMKMLADLSDQFPPREEELTKVASRYIWQRIEDLVEAGQSSTALQLVGVLPQTILSEEQRHKAGAFAYDLIAKDQMQNGQWREAGQTYAEGLGLYPEDRILNGNSKYFAQQWQAAARQESGLEGISEVTQALLELFPGLEDISKSGEQEIRRIAYEKVNAGAFEEALNYLVEAGPFLSDKTSLDLHEYVFDNWAKHHIGKGEWDSAARIYARSRQQVSQSRLLNGNTDYLIQEWAAAETATGGADALIRTTQQMAEIFADIHPYQKVVANVAAIHAQNESKAGEFAGALTFTNDVALLLGTDSADKIRESTYNSWANTLMADGQWREAGAKYVEGRKTLPKSRLLKQNMAYLVQEWARAAFAQGNVEGLIEMAKIVTVEFAAFPDAQDVVSAVASSAAADFVREGDFEEGLRLAEQTKQLMSDKTFNKIVVFSYDSWARSYYEKDWAKAAEIYAAGLVRLPDNALLTQNREYSLSKLK